MTTTAHDFSAYCVIVCDLDGTLVDTEPLHVRSYEQILSALAARSVTVDESDVIGFKEPDIWNRLSERHGVRVDADRAQELRRYVFTGLSALEPPTPAAALIHLLAETTIPRRILTSQSPQIASQLLRVAGVDNLFSSVISTQEPHVGTKIEVLRATLQEFACEPSRLLWIEDASPEVGEAKALGVSLAVVNRDYNRSARDFADFIVSPN